MEIGMETAKRVVSKATQLQLRLQSPSPISHSNTGLPHMTILINGSEGFAGMTPTILHTLSTIRDNIWPTTIAAFTTIANSLYESTCTPFFSSQIPWMSSSRVPVFRTNTVQAKKWMSTSKESSWALVTGCTDGIGRAYCEELASRGFNLVLVSRTASKLAQMEEEFRRRFQKPDYITIPFDFTETSVEAYRTKLLSKIKHLEIGILVNNIGAMQSYPQPLHEVDGGLDKLSEVMILNMYPLTLLTAFVLEQMTKRGKAVVVNISSMMSLSYFNFYYLALYAATNTYVSWLSTTLRQEYAPHKGIIIQTICPGWVITKLSRVLSEGQNSSFFMPDTQSFSRSAVQTIGNAAETSGHIGHQIQTEMLRALPTFMGNFGIKQTVAKMRADWLKKSCSEPNTGKNTNGASLHSQNDMNPTRYRFSSAYINLLEAIRFRDNSSGELWRFRIHWACSVGVYIEKNSNWRQVHWLVSKMKTDENEEGGKGGGGIMAEEKLGQMLTNEWPSQQRNWDSQLDAKIGRNELFTEKLLEPLTGNGIGTDSLVFMFNGRQSEQQYGIDGHTVAMARNAPN